MSPIVVLVACPSRDEADELASALIDEHLVACVNLIDSVRSLFFWNGSRQSTTEVLCVMKTTDSRLAVLTERVKALHSYEVPEVIALPVMGGNDGYIRWIVESVVSE